VTDLFSPRRADGRAEWRVVYDEVLSRPYGDQITFDDLKALLDTDDRNRVHRAVGRCNQVLTRENVPRILGNVRGVGYRILQPGEYTGQALNIQSQARRKMTNAVDLMRVAPLDEMTPAQRNWAHQVTMVLVDNELRLRSQEQWQKDAERRLQELEQRAGLSVVPEVITGEGEPA
jgi:xylose isomerase